MQKRFFLNASLATGKAVAVDEKTYHYLYHVMRLHPCANIRGFNGDGMDYIGKIKRIDKKQAIFKPIRTEKNQTESSIYTILIQCMCKNDKMDFAVQKAVELGVNEVYPVRNAQSVVKLDAKRQAKKHLHWQSMVISACEQSGRARLPIVHPVSSLDEVMKNITADLKLVLHPTSSKHRFGHGKTDKANSRTAVAIGPEGGFSNAEIADFHAHGFISTSIGPRILRAETATVVALTLVQSYYGDWHD